MDLITIQNALKNLYLSLGGDAVTVRDTDDVNTIIDAITGLKLGAAITGGKELPAFPDEDGTYTMQLVMDDGAATFTWEAVTPAEP